MKQFISSDLIKIFSYVKFLFGGPSEVAISSTELVLCFFNAVCW